MSIHRIVSIDLESASYVEIQKVIDLLTKELGTPEVNRWENVKRRRFSDEKITEIEKRADQDLGALDPGEGYRLLKDDEVIQEGDECWCSFCKAWETTAAPGDMPKMYNQAYRRKLEAPKPMIDPGEGYRLLQDDEVIKAGDEFWSIDQNVWTPTTFQGFTPEEQDLTYRRKLETKETSKSDLQSKLWTKIRSFKYHGDAVTWVRRQTDCSFASAGNFVSYVRSNKNGLVPYLTVGTDNFSWYCFTWNL
jgi:hypothetical protein